MARTKAYDENTVLAKARDLFWQRGYTATSIGDLERSLGVSRSSLYAAFGGKRALYDRTLTTYQDENLDRLRTLLEQATDLRQALTELFTTAALAQDTDCRSGARGCYVVNATTELANACPEALNFVADNRERFVALLHDALARAQVRGKLAVQGSVAEWANYLFVCYNGLQVVVQTDIPRPDLVAAVRRSVAALPWVERAN